MNCGQYPSYMQDQLANFRFSHHKDCKVIHTGACFPAKDATHAPLSRQEAFYVPKEDDRSISPLTETHDNPKKATTPQSDDSKVNIEFDRDQEAGHNGPREYVPTDSGKRWLTDRHVGCSCGFVMESDRTPTSGIADQPLELPSERAKVKFDTLHCWSQRDYHHPNRHQ